MKIEDKEKLINLKEDLEKTLNDINMLQSNNDMITKDKCNILTELEQKKKDKRMIELEKCNLENEKKSIYNIVTCCLISILMLALILKGFSLVFNSSYSLILKCIMSCGLLMSVPLAIQIKLEHSKYSKIKKSIMRKDPENIDNDIKKLEELKELHEEIFSIEINKNNNKIEELKTKKSELEEQIISLLSKISDSNISEKINTDELEYNVVDVLEEFTTETDEKVKRIEKTL